MNALLNWRTTLAGALVALGQAKIITGKWAWANDALSTIGALLLGVAAKDAGTARP